MLDIWKLGLTDILTVMNINEEIIVIGVNNNLSRVPNPYT